MATTRIASAQVPTEQTRSEPLPLDLVLCPECGAPAEVEWSDDLQSTDGPVEHAKLSCANRHHFLMPRSGLHPC